MHVPGTLPIHLDHVYILVSENAPEAEVLQSFGLRLYDRVVHHTGQGTASRFFLFKNMYLELIWISDMQEMKDHAERAGIGYLGPEQPWQETGEVPFGIAFHYVEGAEASSLPIGTRRYQEEWMSGSSWIDMISERSIYEPEYFIVSEGMAYLNLPDPDPESDHPLGVTHLTGLHVTVTNTDPFSSMTQFLIDRSVLQVSRGTTPLMEITFDNGMRGKTLDCHPTLPLIIYC